MQATSNAKLALYVGRGLCALPLLCATSAFLATAAGATLWQQETAVHHVRCSNLLGNRVVSAPDSAGERGHLGTAQDFLIDAASGRVTHVIVRSGGLAGIGVTLRCFDIAALSIEPAIEAKPRLALEISAKAFAAAPTISARDLYPFRAEIIATQGHGEMKPPDRFVPRAPILLMSELTDLVLSDAHGGRRLGEVKDAWLEIGARAVGYVSLVGTAEREIPVPWRSCSIVAVSRARALQLCVDVRDTSVDAAPALTASNPRELDEEAFRSRVAAHFRASPAHVVQDRMRN